MYIFRWLMKRPVLIAGLWGLCLLLLIVNMLGGGDHDDHDHGDKIVKTHDGKKHDGDHKNEHKGDDKHAKHDDKDHDGAEHKAAPNTADAQVANEDAAAKIEPSSLTSALVSGSTGDGKTLDVSPAKQPNVQALSKGAAGEGTEFTEISDEEMLVMAREAYWNNGLDEAAQIYQQLIKANPDVIDYRGELGNVYWRQGHPEKAAELYASIAMPMIEAGDKDKVANMVGFIGLYFPEKATEIHNKLQTLE